MKKLGKSGFNRSVHCCLTFLAIVSFPVMNTLFDEQMYGWAYPPMATSLEISIVSDDDEESPCADRPLILSPSFEDIPCEVLEDMLFKKKTVSKFHYKANRKNIEEELVSVESLS